MIKICPECGSIVEHNSYFGAIMCTRCGRESEKMDREESKDKYNSFSEEYKQIRKEAEQDWPEWRKQYYNENFATSKHTLKLPNSNEIIETSLILPKYTAQIKIGSWEINLTDKTFTDEQIKNMKEMLGWDVTNLITGKDVE